MIICMRMIVGYILICKCYVIFGINSFKKNIVTFSFKAVKEMDGMNKCWKLSNVTVRLPKSFL